MNGLGLERLRTSVEKERDQHVAAELKQEKKEAKTQQHLEPFEALAARNERIMEQAKDIINVGLKLPELDEVSGKKSPWVVLQSGSPKGKDWVLGRVTEDWLSTGFGLDSDPSSRLSYDFSIYVTDKAKAERARQHPMAYHAVNEPPRAKEKTYKVEFSYDKSERYRDDDQIMRIARDPYFRNPFNPLGYFERLNNRRSIKARLGNLQETVDLFQAAMADPELNPNLAELVEVPQLRQSA